MLGLSESGPLTDRKPGHFLREATRGFSEAQTLAAHEELMQSIPEDYRTIAEQLTVTLSAEDAVIFAYLIEHASEKQRHIFGLAVATGSVNLELKREQ